MLDFLGKLLGAIFRAPFMAAADRRERYREMLQQIRGLEPAGPNAVAEVLFFYDPMRLEGSLDYEAIYSELAGRSALILRRDWTDERATVSAFEQAASEMSTDVMFDFSRRRFRSAARQISRMQT